jgi:hypothetical protein
MLVPVAKLSAADTIPMLRAGVGDAYPGPPWRGPGHLGGRTGDQLGGPGYAFPVTRPWGHKPVGEAGLSAAAADVTPAELVALLGRSMVGCALAPRIHRTPSTPRRPG